MKITFERTRRSGLAEVEVEFPVFGVWHDSETWYRVEAFARGFVVVTLMRTRDGWEVEREEKSTARDLGDYVEPEATHSGSRLTEREFNQMANIASDDVRRFLKGGA